MALSAIVKTHVQVFSLLAASLAVYVIKYSVYSAFPSRTNVCVEPTGWSTSCWLFVLYNDAVATKLYCPGVVSELSTTLADGITTSAVSPPSVFRVSSVGQVKIGGSTSTTLTFKMQSMELEDSSVATNVITAWEPASCEMGSSTGPTLVGSSTLTSITTPLDSGPTYATGGITAMSWP